MSTTTALPARQDLWQLRHTAAVPQQAVRRFVAHCAGLCLPEKIYWCDGSESEQQMLRAHAVSEQSPGSAAARSGPSFAHAAIKRRSTADVPEAFVKGPLNTPEQRTLHELFRQCMERRTMYVVPFIAVEADQTRLPGVQVTDSAAAALSIRQTCLSGDAAWQQLADCDCYLRLLHSRGVRERAGGQMFWFPRERTVWAYGPGYDAAGLLHAVHATRAMP